MPSLRGNLFGFDYALVWRVTSGGIATGQLNPDSPGTAPQTSHAYTISGPMTCELPGANFGTFDFRGGGAYEGSVDGGLESLSNGTLTVSQCDATLAALLGGGSIDTTTITGGPIIWSPNSLNPSPTQVGLMLMRKHQSQVAATKGTIYYDCALYPKVQMRMIRGNFSQDTGLNTSPIVLQIKPQIAAYFPWGEAFGTNQDWYNNQNIEFSLTSAYPWHMTSFLQDAAETDTVLAYKPIYETVTGGRANSVHSVNGSVTAPSSITASTATVVMSAAGTANQWRVHFYQTSYETV